MSIINCSLAQRVKYVVCSFQEEALTWWNTQIQARGEDVAYALTWNELKELLLREYCPRSEVPILLGRLVTPEYARIERYL